MQTQLLHGAVPQRRHDEVLSALTQVFPTGPARFDEYTSVYTWKDKPPTGGPAPSSVEKSMRISADLPGADGEAKWAESAAWRATLEGIAEPVGKRRPVTIRNVVAAPVTEGNAFAFAEKLGYERAYDYVRRGVTFARRSIILRYYQLFTPAQHLSLGSLQPLDDGGAWYVEMAGTAGTERAVGVAELKEVESVMVAMARELSGYVTLAPIMDNRLR